MMEEMKRIKLYKQKNNGGKDCSSEAQGRVKGVGKKSKPSGM